MGQSVHREPLKGNRNLEASILQLNDLGIVGEEWRMRARS